MALVEKTKIWMVMKAYLPFINSCGINSVELLIWSQDKSLEEVRRRLIEIKESLESTENHVDDMPQTEEDNPFVTME